jgi:asparagine synthase (glutamine-hydrolysing)|tara:strand:- start:400 stop:2286 length:1887 start_codon:yes stop_codon:yes gene_type:complete
MCGINGIINFRKPIENGERIIKSMNKSLHHRGPDDKGTFVSKNKKVVFGHTRLSIVDVKRGHQPIIEKHNESEYSITFNGEVYNHNELRKELQKKKYKFKTHSDTEVILKAYIEWGDKCVHKFVGAFAFAIYDGKKDLVFIARDRTGIKPYYYSLLDDGTFLFSSEPKGILGYPGFKKEPDNETITDYFLGMLTFAAGNAGLDKSFFKGISSMNPGTYAILNKKGLNIKEYWSVPIFTKSLNTKKKNFINLIKKEVENAIKIRIPNEVKFGTALSGGIDSSIITAVADENFKGKLTSSSIKYKNETNNPDFEHAQILSKDKNLKLLTPNLTAEKMISDIDFMIKAMDEPHDAIRQLGMIANYRTLHNVGCKVVLTGEGADEFNLGYYHRFPGLKLDKEECSTSKKFRALWKRRVPHAKQYFTKKFLKSVNFNKIIDYNVSNYYDKCKSNNSVEKMQYFYATKFLKFLQDANDRCSMANSVEARLPFCDHNVIKVALEVPMQQNLKDGTEKYVLREAFKNKLPREIYNRRKAPLPANEEIKLHKLIAKELDKNIKSSPKRIWKILNKEYIIKLNGVFKQRISELENKFGKGKGGEYLTAWLSISQEVEIRTSHVFSVLTFMRWYRMNFK